MPARRFRSRTAHVLLAVLAAGAADARAATPAQIEVQAVLEGRVLVGDTAMRSGTVVLHRVSDIEQGEVDSTRIANGTFTLRLPGLPNPAFGDIYFASVRHQGVMYFGTAITAPSELDSLYVIHAYDTILAPAEGMDVELESRIMFFEPQGDAWTITDVFMLHNELDRTIVARAEGRTWSYPLPSSATDVVTDEGEMSPDIVVYEDGGIVVRGAIPPGARTFVVRYTLPSPEVSIPTPGAASIDLAVREPAPVLEISGLTPAGTFEEGGATYRLYASDSIPEASVQIALGEEVTPPPVQWIAVILAAILAAGGILALRARSPRAASAAAPTDRRQELLLEVARLDEDYQREKSPSEAATREYRARRAALIAQLRKGA